MNPAPTFICILSSHVFLTSPSLVSENHHSLGTDTLSRPFCRQHGGLADAVIECSGWIFWEIYLELMSCFCCSFSGFNYFLKAKSMTSLLLVNIRAFLCSPFILLYAYMDILVVSDLWSHWINFLCQHSNAYEIGFTWVWNFTEDQIL